MRIGIIALLQESNTFIGQSTRLKHFQEELLVTGEEVRERLAGTHHEVAGMFHALEEEHADAVPIFAARAMPFGVLETAAAESLLRTMFAALEKAGPLDGVLVAPHGATVSEPWPDLDGHWLTELRRRLGPDKPIIGTLDPHANVSPAMVAATNALIAYRTNPHLDQRARGIDAARLIVRTVRGDIRPTMAAAFPPIIVNIEKQHTAEEPCVWLYRLADELMRDEQVLTTSIFLGFPYADVPEMGSSFIAVTNNDQPLAQKTADDLASMLWQHREKFRGEFISIDEAIFRANDLPTPVCLLDMGDNVGGGSPGDGTLLAHKLKHCPDAFVCLCDLESVQAAELIGVGNQGTFRLGGKIDDRQGPPLECEATVLGLYDGHFEEPHPRHGGLTKLDQGRTAVVKVSGGLTVMLTSRRMPPFSLRQLTTFGLNPENFDFLVAKGVNAPVAAYKEVCQHFIRVNTPGCTTADLSQLAYQRRRRPMYPFEDDAVWPPPLVLYNR